MMLTPLVMDVSGTMKLILFVKHAALSVLVVAAVAYVMAALGMLYRSTSLPLAYTTQPSLQMM